MGNEAQVKQGNKQKTKSKWCGEEVMRYEVPVSSREYHLRLDQMMERVYAELSQPLESNLDSSSHFKKVINADQSLNTITGESIPEEELHGVA